MAARNVWTAFWGGDAADRETAVSQNGIEPFYEKLVSEAKVAVFFGAGSLDSNLRGFAGGT